jgi:hypothetical protein
MTLVLSHDPKSRITSYFLGYSLDECDEILSRLKRSARRALHPLLNPALIHSTWFRIMFDQHAQIHRKLNSMQQRTGVMKKYLNGGRSKTKKFDRMTQNDHGDVHGTILEQHAYLSNSLSEFVGKIGSALVEGIEAVKKLNLVAYHDHGLHAYVKHWTVRTERELKHREQLLKRIDLQIQVVRRSMPPIAGMESRTVLTAYSCIHLCSNVTVHTNIEISKETRKDSSAMKSRALITTIFLPTTAVAVCNLLLPLATTIFGVTMHQAHSFT